MMLNITLADFYERDINKLIEEVNLFRNEEDLWRTAGSVKNSCGNLVLHLTGGMNYLIGSVLGQSGYIRNRDQEFMLKGVQRKELISQLEKLISIITKTITELSNQQMEAEFPIFFDKPKATTSYVLVQLLLHLNYHLGQVNYLRRMLD